jgi:hypothetical protein
MSVSGAHSPTHSKARKHVCMRVGGQGTAGREKKKKTEEEKKLVIGVVEPPKALGRRLPLLGREHGARSKSIGS